MGLSKGSPSSNNLLVGPHGLAHFRYMRRFFNAPVAVLDELCVTYGSVCRLGFGPLRVVIIGDPTVLRELFATSTESFRWGNKFNVLGFVVGNESMIVSDGPDHTRRRSSVQAAFSRRRLNGWIPMIIERTDVAIDRLTDTLKERDQIVDLYPIGRMLVLEVAIRALFGERLAARTMEIGNLFERPQEYLESSFFKQLPHPFPFTARSRVRSDRRALDAIIDAEIAQRRSQPSGDPLDVLENLVKEGTLSDSEIRNQVVSLIGAGYNTTAASLAWMM
ncbi:MAG: cytochrome P450 [Acidimicrobiaceae bacterium]|nr:cytochrome P450 [Acidimicrobiaceae bacterium]